MAWWRAGVLGALLVSAACSGAETPASSGSVVPASSGSVVPAAFDFAAPAVGGGTVDVRTHAGETVALWFWAPY